MNPYDTDQITALLWYIVRERTHPECPPEKRFVSRIEAIPGEWATRTEAEYGILRWAMRHISMEGK